VSNNKTIVTNGTDPDYRWSDVGNATGTDSTDPKSPQTETSSLLVPTKSTLNSWNDQAKANQTMADDYNSQAKDLYENFIKTAGLTSEQETGAKTFLDSITKIYTTLSATNQLAQDAFTAGQTDTDDQTIYKDGQTRYKN